MDTIFLARSELHMTKNANHTQTEPLHWYDRRAGAMAVVLGALIAGGVVGMRALYTGSLQQYGLTAICLVLAVDRVVDVWLTPKKKLKSLSGTKA